VSALLLVLGVFEVYIIAASIVHECRWRKYLRERIEVVA
jgi:hypothetical protein